MIRSFAAGIIVVPTFVVSGIIAQDVVPGFVNGTLVSAEGGSIELRQATGAIVRCGFDSHTWIEENRQRVGIKDLQSGVPIEILTDRRNGRCYTRTIRLVSGTPTPRPRPSSHIPARPAFDILFPRGNLTFGGVVIRRSPTVLVLRTRTEPEQIVRLRDDTRFLDSGSPATAADIAVNTRVFVRAGKGLDNDLEAYQVIWGRIDGPSTANSR